MGAVVVCVEGAGAFAPAGRHKVSPTSNIELIVSPFTAAKSVADTEYKLAIRFQESPDFTVYFPEQVGDDDVDLAAAVFTGGVVAPGGRQISSPTNKVD